ncbi:ribonuclease H-like domain-containing protein [Tanacetum coccineum]
MMDLRLTVVSDDDTVFDLLGFIEQQIDEYGGQDGPFGKDKLNPLIVDSLLKTIRLSIHLVVYNEELAIPEQTATGKGISNPLMADLEEEPAPTGETSAPPAPKTAKQLAAKRNHEKVKSILLLTIPDEYLLKFHNVTDAKLLWEAIKSRFRVNWRFMVLQYQKEDINQKFLGSLPPSWNQIALIMRNKPDIDKIDIDDLYNNLRVYEDEMKRSSSSTSTSQNLAFLSYENTRSTNEVSTSSGYFGVSTAGRISQDPSTLCTHDAACSFFAQPTTSPQLENEDFQQIDEDDLEELDLRWQVAMLTVRCYNCHRKGHFARECRSRRNQGKRSYGDNGRSNAPTNGSSSQALVAQDGLGGYDWSNDFEIEPVNYALMAISFSSSSSSSDNENLDKLLNSQMSARDKTGLGHGTQLNEMSNNSETNSEISLSIFDVKSSDEESTPANDRSSKADGYHVVPPPITGNFLTPRADISFAGLDEYAIRKKIIESKTTDLNTKTSETVGKTNEANTQKPKTVYESVNRDKVIIEDWNSDDEDDVSEVQTVSPVKTNETQTVKTRVDKIGQTSQKQGIGFKKIKACFVCKSTDHLIKDCNFHDKQSQEPKLKTVVNTGPRVDKPVWDNTKRVNHQKISKYPHLRKTFVPSGVLTRTDSLGKFDGKSNEGYLLGYSTSSKAFRVYNKRTKRVEENLHINFLEDQPNVTGTGPNWMFDLDFLTNSMNYIPVSVENQVNVDAGTQDSYVAGSSGKDKGPTQEYILLPLQPHRTRIPIEDVAPAAHEKPSESSPKDNDIQDSEDVIDKEGQHQMPEDEQVLHDELEKMVTQELTAKAMDDVSRQAFEEEKRRIASQKKAAQATSTNKLSTDRSSVSTDRSFVSTANTSYVSVASTSTGANAGESSFVYIRGKIPIDASTLPNADLPIDPNMPDLEDAFDILPDDRLFNGAYDDDVGGQFKLQKFWVLLICILEKGIGTKWALAGIRRDERSICCKYKSTGCYAQGFRIGGSSLGTIEEEMSSMGELIFFLGLQVKQQPDGIFISQDKYVADILKKFNFLSIRTTTTPIESNKPLAKDEDGVDVDVHVYDWLSNVFDYIKARHHVYCLCL